MTRLHDRYNKADIVKYEHIYHLLALYIDASYSDIL